MERDILALWVYVSLVYQSTGPSKILGIQFQEPYDVISAIVDKIGFYGKIEKKNACDHLKFMQ